MKLNNEDMASWLKTKVHQGQCYFKGEGNVIPFFWLMNMVCLITNYLNEMVYVTGLSICGLSWMIPYVNNDKCIVNIPSVGLKAKAWLVNAHESR